MIFLRYSINNQEYLCLNPIIDRIYYFRSPKISSFMRMTSFLQKVLNLRVLKAKLFNSKKKNLIQKKREAKLGNPWHYVNVSAD